MQIAVFSRENLTKPLESLSVNSQGLTIETLLIKQCSAYKTEFNNYVSAYADLHKIEHQDWGDFDLTHTKELMFVIEPGASLSGAAIAAIIAAVIAVASTAFSLIMMNKLSSSNTGNTKTGSTIYDVNAQGNKVKLQAVIPENFGYFKKFPDYLCDAHSFYRNNNYFIDLVLCQGRGFYSYSKKHDDIYIANTPLSELNNGSVQVKIYEPGTVITKENSIEDGCWYGWYSSIEVTRQGKTLKGAVEEAKSGTATLSVSFGSQSFIAHKYTPTIYTSGSSGPSYRSVKTSYNLPWKAGSYFHISGTSGIRLVSLGSDKVLGVITEQGVCVLYLKLSDNISNLNYLRARKTESVDGIESIVAAGDLLRITLNRTSTTKYISSAMGSQGPSTETASATNTSNFDAEILALEQYTNENKERCIAVTLSLTEADIPKYPDYPTPRGKLVAQSQSDELSCYQPIPADYPYDSDDGLYLLESSADGITYCKRSSDDYVAIKDFEFWSQGVTSTDITFTLDENSSDSAGNFIGPFRACPVGAVSNKFELDFSFPQGLGYLTDDGDFDERTISIQIDYRLVDSNDAWQTITQTWTNNTNDELAYTIPIDVPVSGNYEFRCKNLTPDEDSTRVLRECKWVGLKSCITTQNKYDDMTVIICRFKGTETLSELSENQIWTLWTRKLPTLDCKNADLNDGNKMVATRDLAPVVKYICDNSKYKGIINTTSLKQFDAYWKAKGLYLDGTLDDDNTLLEALKDVLKAGFSSLTVHENKLSFCRLHKLENNEPLTQIFTPQNLTSSPKATITLRRDDSVDEIVVEYIDPATYKTATRYVHLDDLANAVVTLYPTSNNQETLNAFGVVQERVAVAMGLRRLRYLIYTNTKYEIKTELDGLNCQFNDIVGLVLDHNLSNITGRILGVENDVIEVDREIPAAKDYGIIYIRKLDGSMCQTEYTRIDSRHLQLSQNLPFPWNEEYGSSLEYPFFAIGELIKCWVTDVKPNNKSCSLELVNYDERVFVDDL